MALRGATCRPHGRSGLVRKLLMPMMLTAMASMTGSQLGIRMTSWQRLCCTTTCRCITVRSLDRIPRQPEMLVA